MLLLLSLLALAMGPLVYRMAGGHPRGLSFLDGFNLTAITGLVLLAVVPEAVRLREWAAPLFALAGFLGLGVAERFLRSPQGGLHRVAILLGAVVIALHSVTDGAALATSSALVPSVPGGRSEGHLLPLAVLLHQIPVGMTVWWLLRRIGLPVVLVAFALMAAATITGYFAGGALLATLSVREVEWFQAFVGGSLLHVVYHRIEPGHHCTEHHAVSGRAELAGGGVALLVLGLLVLV